MREPMVLPHGAVMGPEMILPDQRNWTAYDGFLHAKSQIGGMTGFAPLWIPDWLFPFQKHLTEWAIRKGRCGLFEDCGLGKTPQFLVWAENVAQFTNGRILVLSPLAVSGQTHAQAEKFGVETYISRTGKFPAGKHIILTNYEKLHLFDANDFAGVVCDESGILKNYDGVIRSQITEFMKKLKYRLLCTATAAPNDYIELGTSSEALGELGYMDMLGRFFKNDQHTIKPMRYTGFGNPRGGQPEGKEHTDKWRFKGHARIPFMQWVCSWARAIRRPSDLGFDDTAFRLPKLTERSHLVIAESLPSGMLFPLPAVGLTEQRDERRRTITERCERAAELAVAHDRSVLWCHLNTEGDLLEELISGCVQVSGADSEDAKEEKLEAFSKGEVPYLVTKSKIAGWGLNWQHCAHTVTFPSHSFEQYYQSIRRFWRFGQTRPVEVDIVTTEGEQSVLENLQRKAKAADDLFTELVAQMNHSMAVERSAKFTEKEEVPAWL